MRQVVIIIVGGGSGPSPPCSTHHKPPLVYKKRRPPLLKSFFLHQNQNQNQNRNGTTTTTSPIQQSAELASKLAQDGRLEDFLMVAETATDPSLFLASLNTKLISTALSTQISKGRLHSVLQLLTRLHSLGIAPSAFLFHKSLHNSLALHFQTLLKARNLDHLLHLMETLAGFFFPVKEFVKPSEIFKLCMEKRDPDAAVRYACMLPDAPTLFSSIILEFGKRGDLMSAVVAYESFKCKSDVPNMHVCRTMIDVCGICCDYMKSRYIYEELLAQNATPNTYVFNSLMNVNAHDLSYALHVYSHMKNLGVTPDLASFNVLLKACSCARRVDLAQDIYEEARHTATAGKLKLDVITYTTIIKVLADAKMWRMALKVKDDMLSAGVTPNLVTWSSLISACAKAGLVEQASQVFKEMLLKSCKPNAHCYNSLLYAYVQARQYDKAFRSFQSWRESGFQSCETRKFNAVGQVCIGAEGSTETAATDLQSCSSSPYYLSRTKVVPFVPTIATFNILMKACGTDYHRANTLMNEIKIAGLSPNQISWSILIDICGSTGNAGGSVQTLKAMRENGIKPDVIAYTTAIKVCVRSKSLKLAFSLFEEMKRYGVGPNLVTYNTLLRARRRYGSLYEVQQCLAIYQDMRKAGYNPNDYFLKELIEEWCEGVITDNNQEEAIVVRSNLRYKVDRKIPQSTLLEKVAAHLQRDVSQSLAVDLRGLSKVEARIIVLAVLRMIKENYTIGDPLENDIVILLGERKETAGGANHKFEVRDAVVKLLRDELGLSVILEGPRVSVIEKDHLNPTEAEICHGILEMDGYPVIAKSSARRPEILERLKVTRKSVYHWLKKRAGITAR